MDNRYVNQFISKTFSYPNKLKLWQEVEIAVIKARANLGLIDKTVPETIEQLLNSNEIDIDWWMARDKVIHHDLNAFLDERLRFIPVEYQHFFHDGITSYDTEEAPFATIIKEALTEISSLYYELQRTIVDLAMKHRFTIMNGRTHGQEAEMQTFGGRCLTWFVDLDLAHSNLMQSSHGLKYSKISGAIGKYGAFEPEIEKAALEILGFEPFYGATQIMPRILYAPIAQNLGNLAIVLDKIANDIRLAARSGRPLMQEPFGKKQKGSSAMPQKKNTIRTEGIEGNAIMAKGYVASIMDCIKTWEERAIAQSRVERVAWPDLFHVVADSLKVLNNVLSGLKVYPDNMLMEIVESRGVYASPEAKEFLKVRVAPMGLNYEDAYRMVQLACFNVFEPNPKMMEVRLATPNSFEMAAELLKKTAEIRELKTPITSIEDFIASCSLRPSEELDIDADTVNRYNDALRQIFSAPENKTEWHKLFTPAHLLRHEAFLFEKILQA